MLKNYILKFNIEHADFKIYADLINMENLVVPCKELNCNVTLHQDEIGIYFELPNNNTTSLQT